MYKAFTIVLLGVLFHLPELAAQEPMTNDRMEDILRQEAEKMEGETGSWMLYFREHIILVLTDQENNRMRIFTPIVEEKELTPVEMQKMLEANFHSALDAKYAFYEGFAVSVFTHPLAELSQIQLVDALQQVVNLASNFGTSYSSTDLIFKDGEEETTPPSEKRINQSPRKQKRS